MNLRPENKTEVVRLATPVAWRLGSFDEAIPLLVEICHSRTFSKL
jgi:hypothetical protein